MAVGRQHGKKDYGGGNYGIQMVGNTRGKLRQGQWRQMYKDGTFNKWRSSETGKRVRTKERLREIEEAKAEAKFAGEVKVKDHELKRAEKEKKEMKELFINLSMINIQHKLILRDIIHKCILLIIYNMS
jgi:hypothetical protein